MEIINLALISAFIVGILIMVDRITITTNTARALVVMILFFYVNITSDIFCLRYGLTTFGIICSIIAIRKNRNPIVWLSAGAWFGVFSCISLFFLPRKEKICPYCYNIMEGELICSCCKFQILNHEYNNVSKFINEVNNIF